jgi:polysaccharide deacetylase 2 family uncharacterized protein YibQ
VKLNLKRSKKTPAPKKDRQKHQFEDGVRTVFIVGALICVAVLGVGGFFAVRSVLSGGFKPPRFSLTSGTETPQETESQIVAEAAPEEDSTPAGTEILPELEEAIRNLETAAPAETIPADTAAAPVAPAAPPPAPAAVPDSRPPATASTTAPTPPVAAPATPVQRRGILVVVIDDAGNNLQQLDPFLKFPGPLTIAVLPGMANSVESAQRIRAARKELFLHQPMEALNGQDQGPAAIKTGMSPAMVKEILVKNFTEIGPIAGFNNHEGSRATADPAIMRPLLEVRRDSSLVFLDSRTTADTVSPQMAKEMGISILQRDIFLDNEQDRASILAALDAGCKRAEQNGIAVLIGHVWTPQLAAILTEMHPQLLRRGFVFAPASAVLLRGK